MRRENFFIRFFHSKLSVIFLLCVLIFLLFSINKVTARKSRVNKDIEGFKKEIIDLEKQKNDLTEMIEYLDTLSFKEKEARLKLGLQKEGEKTVIIVNPYKEKIKKEELEKIESEKISVYGNAYKWWKYFFNKNND